MAKTALLTVGSTEFPSLVSAFLSVSFISKLASSLGITTVYAQIGRSTLPHGFSIGLQNVDGVQVEVTQFADDLEGRVGQSDLVISHAGAGSILSFLRPFPTSSDSQKPTQRRLILVPNDTLMDSHQSDLADKMETKGWATVCRDATDLTTAIERVARDEKNRPEGVKEFLDLDKRKVPLILDETLGYA
ncbi:hypothetical protein JCM16303_005439 [Sporobolomyces ruberrimus]